MPNYSKNRPSWKFAPPARGTYGYPPHYNKVNNGRKPNANTVRAAKAYGIRLTYTAMVGGNWNRRFPKTNWMLEKEIRAERKHRKSIGKPTPY